LAAGGERIDRHREAAVQDNYQRTLGTGGEGVAAAVLAYCRGSDSDRQATVDEADRAESTAAVSA
jgi:hypothetical protein